MRHLAFAFAFFSCAQIAAGQEQETSRENQPTPALEPVTDRETGEFLVGTPYAKQTWAEGLDEKGRPIRRDGKLPTPEGNVVSPSIGGGTNWWSAAYSPRTELYYVNAYDGEQEFFIREQEYREGEQFTGGGAQYVKPGDNQLPPAKRVV